MLASEPYLFGPGVYDPMTAQLVMYYGFKAIYFSGYSFAMGYLGTTDMDLYSGPEIADAARRTVSALRKFQLTQAVGDPEKGTPARHLDIPPLIVDMDGGYGNIFNVQRTTELYVNAGVAAAHIEDQVLPKRCGHIGGKALIPVNEMVGKLRMARAVADDCGNEDFVLIARTDGLSAMDAPESQRGMELAVEPAATSTRGSRTWSGASSRRPTASRSSDSPPRSGSGSRRRVSPSTGRRASSGSTTPIP